MLVGAAVVVVAAKGATIITAEESDAAITTVAVLSAGVGGPAVVAGVSVRKKGFLCPPLMLYRLLTGKCHRLSQTLYHKMLRNNWLCKLTKQISY